MPLNPADWQGDALGNYGGPSWSYHNGRPPAVMYELSDSAVRWWHDNVYDNAALADPQSYAQKLIGDWRAEFARRGGRSNETDSVVMEWVASGTFPIPQNTIEQYNEAARQLAIAQGQTDATDQILIDYGYAHGAPRAGSGDPFYSGALVPPIPGSDVLTGQANVPSPANSGPASNNAYPISLGAPNVSVNMGAPIAGGSGAAAASTPNWLLIAAVAVGVYLLMGGNK